MLIIKLQGGLGNQMFQYAMGQAIAKNGYSDEIKYDLSYYKDNRVHSGYSLEKYFGIHLTEANDLEVKRICPDFARSALYKNLPTLLKRAYGKYLSRLFINHEQNIIREAACYIFDESLFNINPNKNMYLIGYFQNINYYNNIADELKAIFRYIKKIPEKDKKLAEQMRKTNSVAIHIRRGDYSGSGYDLCGLDYFKKAIELIEEKNSIMFYVFTDDIDYVKKNFGFLENYKVCSHDIENCDLDMYLMGQCKTVIISNSSFSFWGAFLSDNGIKIIAPKFWYNNGKSVEVFNLPTKWNVIDNIEIGKDNNERQ